MRRFFRNLKKRIYGDEVLRRLKEEKAKAKKKRSLKLLKRFLRYLKPYWRRVLGAFICMTLSTLLSLPGPLITRYLIDEVLPKKNVSMLILLCLLTVAIFLFSQLIGFIRKYLFLILSERVVIDIRLDFYQHLQRLPMSFYAETKTGDVMSRLMNDVGAVRGLLADTFLPLIQDIIVLIASTAVIFYLHWKLSLLSLITLPFFILSFNYFSRRLRVFSRLGQEKRADLYSNLQERIAGISLTKSFAKEKQEAIGFLRYARKLIDLGIKKTVFGSISGVVMGFVSTLGTALVMWYGGMEVIRGNFTIGSLIAFTAFLGRVHGPLKRVFQVNLGIQASLAAVERVVEILEMPQEGKGSSANILLAEGQKGKWVTPSFGSINLRRSPKNPSESFGPVKNIVGLLEFENVSFGYASKRDVLKNINIKVSPGMIIGLVGPSGVGKTTLVRLILRFYVPTKGRILIDEIDAGDFNLRWLRSQIGIVAQDNILFSGTLRENIAYAQRKTPIDEIETAAKMAQIHEFIAALPEGYDTQVGERGVKLSGGQRRRIAIARMIIANPQIVILDEATSFLDTETETKLWTELKPWLRNRTAIVIAHRLSTIEDADNIFVLNSGKIVEEGSHERLYSSGGFYKQLYDQQSRKRTEVYAQNENDCNEGGINHDFWNAFGALA